MTGKAKLTVHTKPTGYIENKPKVNHMKPQTSKDMSNEETPLYPAGMKEDEEKPTTCCQLKKEWADAEFLPPSEINHAISKGKDGNEDEDGEETPLLPNIK